MQKKKEFANPAKPEKSEKDWDAEIENEGRGRGNPPWLTTEREEEKAGREPSFSSTAQRT